MYNVPGAPATESAAFEADYLTATLRARRDFTWAQRAAVIGVLTGSAPDPRTLDPSSPQPALRSFSLILARCESAATLLGWRKQITPEQKQQLDVAMQRLQDAASQVPVRAGEPALPPQRPKYGEREPQPTRFHVRGFVPAGPVVGAKFNPLSPAPDSYPPVRPRPAGPDPDAD